MKNRFVLLTGAAALIAACSHQSKPPESAASDPASATSESGVAGVDVPPNSTLPATDSNALATTGTSNSTNDTTTARSMVNSNRPENSSDNRQSGTTSTGTGTSGQSATTGTTTGTTTTTGTSAQNTTQTTTPSAGTQTRSTDTAGSRTSDGRAADNTGRNERDRDSNAVTPGDQGNNASDLKITQAIRKAVMGNNSLSVMAKNVRIITAGGKVTLRGPVKTQEERAAIQAAAQQVAGVTQVDNQLEVK